MMMLLLRWVGLIESVSMESLVGDTSNMDAHTHTHTHTYKHTHTHIISMRRL